MGLYTTIHLSAGIRIPDQKEICKVKDNTCGCKTHYDSSVFCSECGKEIKFVEVEKEFYIDLIEEIGSDAIFPYHQEDGHTIFLANTNAGCIDSEENEAIKITPDLIDKTIKEFKEAYAQEINSVEEMIAKKVEVEFFFLHDRS